MLHYTQHRMLAARTIPFAIFTVICCFFVFALPAHAQISPLGGGDIHLVAEPSHPRPNEPVSVSLNDYSVNTTGASTAWYVNGVLKKEFANARTISIPMGNIGEKTTVRADISRASGDTLSASLTLTPSVIDIILEANTYVPYFYAGRALPSMSSIFRAVAIVHDATHNPESAYTYKWTLGNSVLLGGKVKGKNSIDLQMPLFGNEFLQVEVFDANGVAVGSNLMVLRAVEPELHFYEESPLRGLSRRELRPEAPLIGEEMTVYGEPYFMNVANGARTTWMVGGQEMPSAGNSVAIRREMSAGSRSAQVNLEVLSQSKIPQMLQKAFTVLFE